MGGITKGQDCPSFIIAKRPFLCYTSSVMEKIKLEKRELTGKKIKKIRDEDKVPAVIYNSKGESINVKVDRGTAVQLYKTATPTTILDIEVEKSKKKAIVKDFDINPRTDRLLHISFFEIDPKATMDFTIPFTLEGVAPAVKNNIGILVKVTDSIRVRCKLEQLIDDIKIDVTTLEHPGQGINMRDIELPEGIELVHEEDRSLPIATISQLQKLEVVEETEEDDDEEEVEGEEGDKEEGEGDEEASESDQATSEEPGEE